MPRPARAENKPARRSAPAFTLEEREDQLIALAMDLAEEQMRDKTVSAQVLAQFVRAGSSKDRLELEKLKKENQLLLAKTEALQSSKRVEELYKNALTAMKSYSGNLGNNEGEYEDDQDVY